MANYNKVILIGNLTRDPQMSYLPSQTPVAEFGLAINRRWRDRQSGEQREETCFIDCRAYGKPAETLNQYVRKGSPIMVEGRLQLDTWEGKDGQKRSRHRVVVENFQFLGGGAGGSGGQGRGYAAPSQESSPAPYDDPSYPPDPYGDSGGDDIPF